MKLLYAATVIIGIIVVIWGLLLVIGQIQAKFDALEADLGVIPLGGEITITYDKPLASPLTKAEKQAITDLTAKGGQAKPLTMDEYNKLIAQYDKYNRLQNWKISGEGNVVSQLNNKLNLLTK